MSWVRSVLGPKCLDTKYTTSINIATVHSTIYGRQNTETLIGHLYSL